MLKYKSTGLAVFLLSISISSVAASLSYSPSQLYQFNISNQCFNCDLSGAMLRGNHSKAVINDSNLTGANGSGTFSMANFSGSNLSSSTWMNANLSYAQLNEILLTKVNFTGANLSFANFNDSNTNDAIFNHANLFGSNITQEQLNNAASYCGATLPDGSKKTC